jgi:hypothetical protein
MKIVSYPPFIVFFDTIAVFLFFLILNQNKAVDIVLPPVLWNDAELFYEKDNHYFPVGGGNEYKGKNMELLLDCGKQIQCIQAKRRYGDNVYILLPEEVFDKISKLTMMAFETESCSSVKYTVNKNKKLDYKTIQQDNDCLNKIAGFTKMIQNNN